MSVNDVYSLDGIFVYRKKILLLFPYKMAVRELISTLTFLKSSKSSELFSREILDLQ